ncbi:MAG TPA: 3-oxoacyl-[acyl-carrier-protein] synthase III C-terminal domain-containing protein [Planctomycetota bacterium]|nr:3-oxoacyl-[acyl-carrier-protein] synthase III C-terminal domain-containing protein [Planctomycetota bacterium]
MKIAAVATVFPPHWYEQSTLTEYLVAAFGAEPRFAERLRSLHANTGVQGRHLILPLEAYGELTDFTRCNAAWLQGALDLGEQACRAALARADLEPADVDIVFFATVTGLASPSVEARLIQRLGMRADCKRVPIFGLGCVAGAAAVARAADYVKSYPDGVALVLTVELCSLTLQREDRSVANLVSTGLFGDGAAAAVVVGAGRRKEGPEVLATRSVFYPETERMMGWDTGSFGFRIVLSAEVPTVARERVPGDVDDFLRDLGRSRADIARWIAHPGGPKVLQALQEGLGLHRADLECSWQCLRRVGNLSSVSVLMILEETMQKNPGRRSDLGLMVAMGPGFCSELLLLRW